MEAPVGKTTHTRFLMTHTRAGPLFRCRADKGNNVEQRDPNGEDNNDNNCLHHCSPSRVPITQGAAPMLSGENLFSYFVVVDDKEDEACAEKALCYCLAIMKSMKNLTLTDNPELKLRVRAAIHNGPVMAGFRSERNRNPRFRIFGSSMTTIVDLLQVSRPNCLLVTQLFAKMVETNDDIKLIEGFQQEFATGERHRTFWVVSKLNSVL